MTLPENFDNRHELYLTWLVTPVAARSADDPTSKEAFAKKIGVSQTTLRNWEAKEWFKEEWRKRVTALAGAPERTQRLLDSLFDKALNGDMKAAALYLQSTGQMAPAKLEVATTEKSSRELTDEELDALIAQRATAERNERTKLRAV